VTVKGGGRGGEGLAGVLTVRLNLSGDGNDGRQTLDLGAGVLLVDDDGV
jgi:hypothetical protein